VLASEESDHQGSRRERVGAGRRQSLGGSSSKSLTLKEKMTANSHLLKEFQVRRVSLTSQQLILPKQQTNISGSHLKRSMVSTSEIESNNEIEWNLSQSAYSFLKTQPASGK